MCKVYMRYHILLFFRLWNKERYCVYYENGNVRIGEKWHDVRMQLWCMANKMNKIKA